MSGPQDEIKFSHFVVSIFNSACIALGEVANPLSGKVEKDLAAAGHSIGLLGMLGEKTKGNLDEEEARLLKNCLSSLRMRYVEMVRADKTNGEKDTPS